MKILIGWELGGNYGHLLALLPVLNALRARGHQLLLAAGDVSIAETLLAAAGHAFIQAPLPHRRTPLTREIASHADILASHGFADFDVLLPLVRSWQDLYRLYQPDAVVVNHAPAALFTALLLDIPVIEIGTGFEIPPESAVYPCFRPWLKLPDSALQQMEETILSNLNRLRIGYGKMPCKTLCDTMLSEQRLLMTFAEIDHYPHREKAEYAGPLSMTDEGLAVEWPAAHEKNILVYMRPTDRLVHMLDHLARIDANVICTIPGIDLQTRARYAGSNLIIHSELVMLAPLLQHCDLAITFGGHGLTSACLIAGIPMMLIPTQVEQLMLSNRIMQAGTGLALSLYDVPAHFETILKRLLVESAFERRARDLAERYSAYDQRAVGEHVVDLIEQSAK